MAQSIVAPQAVLGVVFDGDDTLWSTEPLYDHARSRAKDIVAKDGFDGDEWERIERQLDVLNVAEIGYSTERFPTSCVQAYETLCRRADRPVQHGVTERIRKTAEMVFNTDAPLCPGARNTLATLRSRGVRLALLTKGDPELQLRRIERSGLRDYFDVVRIVTEKSPTIIRETVDALGVDPGSAWMIGNSVRSDILPAVRAGMRAVWIDAHVWEHERSCDPVKHERVINAKNLRDIPALIA